MKHTYKFLPLFLAGALAFAQANKVAPELQSADRLTNVRVIVQYDKDPTEAHHQKVANKGGSLIRTLHSVKAGVYSVPASALPELAKDPDVVHISQDHKISAKMDYTSAAVNAPAAWQSGWTGKGIGVAVIDSGINPTGDTKGSYTAYQNFVTDSDNNANDLYGHGMHVAGIIASNGSSSSCGNCTRNMTGLAPNASLINLRVLDANGEATDSNVIAAIETAIQYKSAFNIRVMNLSLGRPVFESYTVDPLCQAVEAAWKSGIVVVVAAGNDGRDNSAGNSGYGTITAPGNDPYVITVGAMKTMQTYGRSDDLIASYSSKGPTLFDNVVKPDIVAPGNQVVSLLAPGNPTLQNAAPQNLVTHAYYQSPGDSGLSDRYITLSGTSMATAVVSGAVADLLQAQPSLTPDQVKIRLMTTAYKVFPRSSVAVDPTTGQSYTSYYDVFTRGAGYLDLAATLATKATVSGTAMSPTATFNNTTQTVYITFAPSSAWANTAAWGSSLAAATNATWGSTVINADRSMWAQRSMWAERSMWATASASAENTTSGERSTWATGTEASDATPIAIAGEQ